MSELIPILYHPIGVIALVLSFGGYVLWNGIHFTPKIERYDLKKLLSNIKKGSTPLQFTYERVIPFNSKNRTNLNPPVRQVGGKGYSLINMTNHNINVPPGIVLTTFFFTPWIEELEKMTVWKEFMLMESDDLEVLTMACDKVKNSCQHHISFTNQQITELLNALGEFEQSSLFAVRSSSPEEDLSGSSFAGGYETILAVPNKLSEIEEAVKTVFVSCLDARVVMYKKQHNFNIFKPSIAVIIQQQIHSKVAGVVFSVNPVSNSYDEAVINSNWGVGESVVSGEVSPDQFIVHKYSKVILDKQLGTKEKIFFVTSGGGIMQQTNDHGQANQYSLNDSQIHELTSEIVHLEEIYKSPIDIEFAYDIHDQLYLLQARPITAYVSLPPSMITKPGLPKFLYLDATLAVQGLVDPVSVFGMDLLSQFVSHMFSEFFGSIYPYNLQSIAICAENGRLYVNLSNVFAILGNQTSISKFFSKKMDNTLESMISQATADYNYQSKSWIRARVILAILHAGILKKLYRVWSIKRNISTISTILHAQIRQTKSKINSLCGQVPFGQFIQAAIRSTKDLFAGLVLTIVLSQMSLGKMTQLVEDKDALPDPYLEKLKCDLCKSLPNNVTTEMGIAISNVSKTLIGIVDDIPSVEALEEKLENKQLPKSFQTAWKYLLDNYGHRGEVEFDVATPRFCDNPRLLLHQIYLQAQQQVMSAEELLQKGKMERENAKDVLLGLVLRRGGSVKDFTTNYEIYTKLGGFRESPKECLIYTYGKIRLEVQKIAQQWVSTGQLKSVEDIWNLKIFDIIAGLEDPTLDLMGLSLYRKKMLDSFVPVVEFPKVFDSRGKIFRYKPPPSKEGELIGFPISPGIVTAQVKVLKSPNEKPLHPGEILVARATNPGWTPLFINASGVILEIGGMLQHGALVAREYGKPCVAGIHNITNILKDGMLVQLDGSTGVVKIINT